MIKCLISVDVADRSVCQQQCGSPPCPVFGPRLSGVPVHRRPANGLTNACLPTWPSSTKTWSALPARTMLRASLSKNCMYASPKSSMFCNEIWSNWCFELFPHQIVSLFFFYFWFSRVSTLGPYNYSAVDFMRQDVFDTIRTYLASGQSAEPDVTLINQSINQLLVVKRYIISRGVTKCFAIKEKNDGSL